MLNKLESLGISGNLHLFRSFLNDRYQRVALNDQVLYWAPVLSGVLQGSILEPLLFFIYIIVLPDNLTSSIQLFVDDTSLFSTVYDPNHTEKVLDEDLNKTSEWAYQLKMLFNPDLTKQTQEVIFSRKNIKTDQPIVCFNEALVAHPTCQKTLRYAFT